MKLLSTFEKGIKYYLTSSCYTSIAAFKEENRIPNNDGDSAEEAAPLLVGDETNKEMPYTQEATIRTHYKKLRKFIKLVDYLILESKTSLLVNTSDKLNRTLQSYNHALAVGNRR